MKRIYAALVIAFSLIGVAMTPAWGQPLVAAVLSRLDPGAWELRYRGDSGEKDRICVKDGSELIQLRHPGLRCRQIIVEDSPSLVTVQYMCPGSGYGRTQIRRETGRLVQFDSQGIVHGSPFAFSGEARRVGSCP